MCICVCMSRLLLSKKGGEYNLVFILNVCKHMRAYKSIEL